MTQAFNDSKGNTLEFNERNGQRASEACDSLQTIKRMRLGLLETFQDGNPEEFNQKPSSGYLAQGPPTTSFSNGVHWKKLDPTETIVLSQATILRVNELL
jgi:hypothetical protein